MDYRIWIHNHGYRCRYPRCILVLNILVILVAMFTISRIILGFGIPYGIVGASSLIGETAYPKERATLTAVFNASWFIGAIVAASITLGTFAMPNTWSWRIPSFLQVVPSLLQIIFMPWMPESPRFVSTIPHIVSLIQSFAANISILLCS